MENSDDSSYNMDTNDSESEDAGFFNESDDDYNENRSAEQGEANVTADGQATDRKIIYNADMSIEVNNFNKALKEIQDRVERIGGFVVESSQHESNDERRSGNLTVRVPRDTFHSFLNDIESTSTKLLEKYVSGNDVTEEYVDLESRIRSQEVVEERLLSFMNDAENTEDLLQISRDLSKVQEDLERITGRINYLDNHVAFSTVNIHIREKTVSVSSLQDSETLNTWTRAESLFMNTLNVIISFFSGAVVLVIGLSPILLPLIGIILIIFLYQRKLNKNKGPDK